MIAPLRLREGFSWPNGARLAVLLTSEYEPVYTIKELSGGHVDYRRESEMRYEATAGIWRVLRVLARHGVRSTFFVNGASAERYPESVQAIVSRGHEVAAHSWSSTDHFSLPYDAEDELIRRTTQTLESVAGVRPNGWLTPRAQMSANTMQLIVKHGYHWHSDFFDDDMPYVVDVDEKRLVEIPRSLLTDDYALIGPSSAAQFGPHRNALAMWLDEFDVLYQESATEPRLFSITWHQCRIGRPALSKLLDDLLTHIRKHDGVWFARGDEIARCVSS
jgi:peptidoglycan/xylan/chitin deacetylase (PgdA/CDA1 family)